MTPEHNTRNINAPGTYKHPGSGAMLEAQTEPQADALVHQGWVAIVGKPAKAKKVEAEAPAEAEQVEKL